MSSSDGDYRLCAQWSFGIRLLVAAPGVLAALLLWAVGGYLLISSASDSSMAADEEFASIAALGALVGAVAVAIGLYLAVAAVAVAGKRPRAIRLTLAAVALLSGALGVGCLLATGADAMPYAPLLAVQLYLATVALARLFTRRRQDAQQARQPDAPKARSRLAGDAGAQVTCPTLTRTSRRWGELR